MVPAIIFTGVFIIVVIVGWVIFRQQRDAAWKRFATEIGAEFIEGGLFRTSKVQAHINDSAVVLDSYSVSSGDSSTTYTRIRAPFQNKDGFQFTLFRTGLVSKIDKALGAQDIEIGDADFDRDFTIQSNNESKVRALFASLSIRQLIQAQRSIRLRLKENELHFEVQGIIKDLERLKSLFELFREMLGRLEG